MGKTEKLLQKKLTKPQFLWNNFKSLIFMSANNKNKRRNFSAYEKYFKN